MCYNINSEGGEKVNDIKDILEIIKDLLEILVLVLTARQLIRPKKTNKSRRRK